MRKLDLRKYHQSSFLSFFLSPNKTDSPFQNESMTVGRVEEFFFSPFVGPIESLALSLSVMMVCVLKDKTHGPAAL
jgi:hypothetical protein